MAKYTVVGVALLAVSLHASAQTDYPAANASQTLSAAEYESLFVARDVHVQMIDQANSFRMVTGHPEPESDPQSPIPVDPLELGVVGVWRFDDGAAPELRLEKVFWGEDSFDEFGYAVHAGGDVNGDGVMDLIVGAPGALAEKGKVHVFCGATATLIRSISGEAAGDRFGTSVEIGADLDGDGVGDLVVGAPYNDAGATNAGRVYVYSGATGDLLRTYTNHSLHAHFGVAVLSFIVDLDVGGGLGQSLGFGLATWTLTVGDGEEDGNGSTLRVYSDGETSALGLAEVLPDPTSILSELIEYGPAVNEAEVIGNILQIMDEYGEVVPRDYGNLPCELWTGQPCYLAHCNAIRSAQETLRTTLAPLEAQLAAARGVRNVAIVQADKTRAIALRANAATTLICVGAGGVGAVVGGVIGGLAGSAVPVAGTAAGALAGGATGAAVGAGSCALVLGVNANAANQTYQVDVQAAAATENVLAWGVNGMGGVQHQIQDAIDAYDAAIEDANLVFANCLLEELRALLEALELL